MKIKITIDYQGEDISKVFHYDELLKKSIIKFMERLKFRHIKQSISGHKQQGKIKFESIAKKVQL